MVAFVVMLAVLSSIMMVFKQEMLEAISKLSLLFI